MIPDWKLERYLTGDLPESEMREIADLEKRDAVLANRVKMLREDGVAILQKMPFDKLAARLDSGEHSASGGQRETRGHFTTGEHSASGGQRETRDGAELNGADNVIRANFGFLKYAVAAAFVVALVSVALLSQHEVVPAGLPQAVNVAHAPESRVMDVAMAASLTGDASDTRIKGMDSRMEVWKKTGDSAVQLNNLDEAREGDEIQLRYSVPEKCFGLLFSMDGNGTVTMHMAEGNRAVELAPGKMTTLPFAYKLDNAPKFEKFFLLTSHRDFSLEIAKLDSLLKDKKMGSVSITLRKVGGDR